MTRPPVTRIVLTPGERSMLDAIRTSITDHGFPPTVTDLCTATGLSRASVHHYLVRLDTKGWISRIPGSARAIRLLDPEGSPA